MSVLTSALYAEGRSDEHFLPVLLQRTIAELLNLQATKVVDVLEPVVLRPVKQRSHEEAILRAAQLAVNYHLLFIHADADDVTAERAYMQRIEPGLGLVQSAADSGIAVCHYLVPVIPVQMIEAWLLADAEAVSDVVGMPFVLVQKSLPLRAHEVEALADPKAQLEQVVRQAQAARPRRRRNTVLSDYYEPMAYRLRLEKLRRLPAFQAMEAELADALRHLGFLGW